MKQKLQSLSIAGVTIGYNSMGGMGAEMKYDTCIRRQKGKGKGGLGQAETRANHHEVNQRSLPLLHQDKDGFPWVAGMVEWQAGGQRDQMWPGHCSSYSRPERTAAFPTD